ncbi:PipA/GogA/GtgA family type III secretion system effector [Pararobbsia silviterrae]|nr:PipA/GogA/GtgA family type III secretion system effector [Pararobbsia silviterrae]
MNHVDLPAPGPSGIRGRVRDALVACLSPADLAFHAANEALASRFPDLWPQVVNPSPARRLHDAMAQDGGHHYAVDALVSIMIFGPGAMDPDAPVDRATYLAVHTALAALLMNAYTQSETFRRLFNHAAQTTLPYRRWHLSPDDAFGTTIGDAQRWAAGDRAVMALNLDPADPDENDGNAYCDDNEYYASELGVQRFGLDRSFLHEVIHVLTELPDADGLHVRGPIVEYENIVLKEIGDPSPARITYACE